MPKGTGLVETAAAAGIEIPVFCYEPRLGPPVGACRMCLVEIEGMPKLQAGCTLTAQDGMVVKTAATSEKAAEGQNATLEFILVNHPLDCPVCDKGGECPLQDLTFRYGPGNTRMSFPKLTLREADPGLAADRARPRALHPLLPLHALLRGRRRGRAARRARTAARTPRSRTFDERPVPRAVLRQRDRALPRRRAHLDAVPLRARGPWDIQNVPTVCGALPRRLQRQRDDPRGQGQARSSRATTPRSTTAGSATRAASRIPHLRADDRITEPLRRGQLGLEADQLGRGARPRRGAAPRRRHAHRHRALGLGDGRAGLRARPPAARRPRRARRRPARGDLRRARRLPAAALRASPTPRSSSSSATTPSPSAPRSSISGSRPAAATAPRSCTTAPTGTVPTGPGGAAAALPRARRAGQRARASGFARPSGRSSSGRAAAAAAARGWPSSRTRSASRASPAAAPSTCRRRRTAAASPRPGPQRPTRTTRTPSRSAS